MQLVAAVTAAGRCNWSISLVPWNMGLKSGRQVEMTTCPLRKFIRIAHSLNLKAFVDTPYDTLKIQLLETYLTS